MPHRRDGARSHTHQTREEEAEEHNTSVTGSRCTNSVITEMLVRKLTEVATQDTAGPAEELLVGRLVEAVDVVEGLVLRGGRVLSEHFGRDVRRDQAQRPEDDGGNENKIDQDRPSRFRR